MRWTIASPISRINCLQTGVGSFSPWIGWSAPKTPPLGLHPAWILNHEVGGMLKRKVRQEFLSTKQAKTCPISGTIQLYLKKIKGTWVKTSYRLRKRLPFRCYLCTLAGLYARASGGGYGMFFSRAFIQSVANGLIIQPW